jgi:deoxyhypusine synthase
VNEMGMESNARVRMERERWEHINLAFSDSCRSMSSHEMNTCAREGTRESTQYGLRAIMREVVVVVCVGVVVVGGGGISHDVSPRKPAARENVLQHVEVS